MTLKIAVAVHGRFHAFDLARALLERGNNVTVFTNYPKWAVERFGIGGEFVRSFWAHGLITRAAWKLDQAKLAAYQEKWFHPLFGRWVCSQIQNDNWDVVHCWSGIAEETLRGRIGTAKLHLMVRGSAHIRVQAELLRDEEARTNVAQEHPSPWIIDREEREYLLADKIVVLSTFAYNTFISQGFPASKLGLMRLGAKLRAFHATGDNVRARARRILSNEPLRILYVGALSFRKGLWDLATVVRDLSSDKDFEFRFVGPQIPETNHLVSDLRGRAVFTPKLPQSELPAVYAWGDVFVFPTIEDGYAVVLAQAAAAGLPIVTTPNCAGPDLVQEGITGWILPIRNSQAIIERLRWCAEHRSELAEMACSIPEKYQPRDWTDVAADFERICYDGLDYAGWKRDSNL